MSLRGKVALVTGAARNPGADTSREMAREGAELALHYHGSRSKEQTLRLREQLQRSVPGIKISIHSGDLSTAAAIDELFSDVLAEHRRIDLVVNTAGMVLRKPTTGISEAEYDKMFAYAVFVDEQRRKWTDRYTDSVQRLQARS